jgi:hypothetical protein
MEPRDEDAPIRPPVIEKKHINMEPIGNVLNVQRYGNEDRCIGSLLSVMIGSNHVFIPIL